MVIKSSIQSNLTKPVYPGVYLVTKLFGGELVYAYFNGINWSLPAYLGGVQQALEQKDNVQKGSMYYWVGVVNV
jgi:hypothetical protein